MNRKDFFRLSGILGLSLSSPSLLMASTKQSLDNTNKQALFLPAIDDLRKLAHTIVGPLPEKINVTKVADTIRPASIVVKGESPDRKMDLARTVYQLQYLNGTIMIDSGMDLATHRTFGKTKEPYYPENYAKVQKALLAANLIIITHYHADHTAGVVRSKNFDKIAHKVWVSEDTADLMLNHPHKETVKISKEHLNRFLIGDFRKYNPIAPGVVLFKAPGHTPDSKMLYIKLASGKEFIHSVDSGWSMENIRKETIKNASWVHENTDQLKQQYRWLNELMRTEKNITVLCTHDNEQYISFREKGILGKELKLD